MAGVIAALLGLVAVSLNAAPGDLWEVKQYSTNVRTGPGTDHSIAFQSARADVLMELERDGDWLEIRAVRTQRQGWVRDDLLRPLTERGEAKPSDAFSLFKRMLEDSDGVDGLFEQAHYLGYATVEITVTPLFLDAPLDSRMAQLQDLLRIWQTVDNTGIPATVLLRERDGRRLASGSALTGTHGVNDDPPADSRQHQDD